jgi:hypothetical protein
VVVCQQYAAMWRPAMVASAEMIARHHHHHHHHHHVTHSIIIIIIKLPDQAIIMM